MITGSTKSMKYIASMYLVYKEDFLLHSLIQLDAFLHVPNTLLPIERYKYSAAIQITYRFELMQNNTLVLSPDMT